MSEYAITASWLELTDDDVDEREVEDHVRQQLSEAGFIRGDVDIEVAEDL